jgi:cytoskeletal protein CcmA (bactofilin family)
MPRSEQTEVSPPMVRSEQTAPMPTRGLVSDSRPQAASPRASSSGENASIGKSIIIRGEVSGSESLFIEGKVEGAINLPDNRVTIARNGEVVADIRAREIVVLGEVHGNCQATDRVDIRSEGSLTGNVVAARISIEDGAFFKGGIELRKPATSDVQSLDGQKRMVAVEGSPLAALYDAQAEEEISQGNYQTLDDDSDLQELIPRWRSARPALSHTRTA